jgi:hypothetical protein
MAVSGGGKIKILSVELVLYLNPCFPHHFFRQNVSGSVIIPPQSGAGHHLR